MRDQRKQMRDQRKQMREKESVSTQRKIERVTAEDVQRHSLILKTVATESQ